MLHIFLFVLVHANYLHVGPGIVIKGATDSEVPALLSAMPEFKNLGGLSWIPAPHVLNPLPTTVGPRAQLNQYHLTSQGGIMIKINIPSLGEVRLFSPNKRHITATTSPAVIADWIHTKFWDLILEWLASKKATTTHNKSLSLRPNYRHTITLVRDKCGGTTISVYVPEFNAVGIQELKAEMIEIVIKACDHLEKHLPHGDIAQALKATQKDTIKSKKISKKAHTAYTQVISLLNNGLGPLPDDNIGPTATGDTFTGKNKNPHPENPLDDDQEQKKKEALEKAKREKFQQCLDQLPSEELQERKSITRQEHITWRALFFAQSEEQSKIRAKEREQIRKESEQIRKESEQIRKESEERRKESEQRDRAHEAWRREQNEWWRNYEREEIERRQEERRKAKEYERKCQKEHEEKLRAAGKETSTIYKQEFFKTYGIKYEDEAQFRKACRQLDLELHPDKIQQRYQNITKEDLDKATEKYKAFNNLREKILK